jgi:hypothetical protein
VFERRALLDYLRSKQIEYIVDTEDEVVRRFALYDSGFGDTPPHPELGAFDRVQIYLKLVAQSIGVHAQLKLDDNRHSALTRPITDALTRVLTVPRPNEATNPVVIDRIK